MKNSPGYTRSVKNCDREEYNSFLLLSIFYYVIVIFRKLRPTGIQIYNLFAVGKDIFTLFLIVTPLIFSPNSKLTAGSELEFRVTE